MYLEQLRLHNFRCFEDLNLEFHHQLTVLVGNNGAGKTAIMEGAAVAAGTLFVPMDNLYGRKITRADAHLKSFALGSTKDVQPQYPVTVTASGTVEGRQGQWIRSLNSEEGNTTFKDARFLTELGASYQERMRAGDSDLILPIIAYYGTSRLWDYRWEKRLAALKTNTRTNGYTDCLEGTTNIKMMMNWFKRMTIQKYQRMEENLGGIPELDTVYNAMCRCFEAVTGYQDVRMQYNLNTNDLDVYYTNRKGLRMQIPLHQLSDGYKSTISLIADIAYRMAVLNPQLLDRVLEQTSGIILIDEIDLHLHPAWQQRVLKDLTSIFPKVQFIVSTHAPAVINSVRSENLLILKDYQILRVGNEVYGKDVKSVLNEIMGVAERPPEVAQMFQDFYVLMGESHYDEAEQMLDQIDKLRDYHDPEVAGCRVKLKLERIRGKRV